MSSFLPTLARWLHTIALSLWLGGLVAIGALVAPVAFHVTRILSLPNAVAGDIVGGSLHLFNFVCYACGVLLLLSNALLLPHADRRWAVACLVTASLLLASALCLGLSITPSLDAARSLGNMADFDRMHHQYEQISTLFQFPLLLLLAWFASLRDTSLRKM